MKYFISNRQSFWFTTNRVTFVLEVRYAPKNMLPLPHWYQSSALRLTAWPIAYDWSIQINSWIIQIYLNPNLCHILWRRWYVWYHVKSTANGLSDTMLAVDKNLKCQINKNFIFQFSHFVMAFRESRSKRVINNSNIKIRWRKRHF